MSEDYKRGYSKGYWAGSTGRWPEHKPPLPPEEKLRALIVVTQELRDELDVACAMFDEDDEFVKCLAPKIDALDAAMAQIGAWIREIPPGERTAF